MTATSQVIDVAVMVIVCGRHGLWPSLLWPSWSSFVAVMVCGRHGCGRHGHRLWPSWFVSVMVVAVMVIVCGRYGL